MSKFGSIDGLAYLLVIVGALNWGLVGVFDYNVVHAMFGSGALLTKIVYILVGLSAVYFIAFRSSAFGKK